MKLVERVHHRHVAGRRAQVLSERLAPLLPDGGRVLDVGCGDGVIAALIVEKRHDVTVTGVDVLVRPGTPIEVIEFDGHALPFADDAFETVMMVDVLHHTEDPMILLREAARVASRCIVLKDHTREGWLAGATLRFMDRIGNARYGVSLPYNYWSRQQWQDAFDTLAWQPSMWEPRLNLYGWPAGLIFDRALHFVTCLCPAGTPTDLECNSRPQGASS